MVAYKDELDTVAHNFNTSTLTIDGTHKVEGLEMVEVDLDNDEVEIQSVASGVSQFVENPTTSGTFKFTFLEATVTTDYLYEKRLSGTPVSISFTDSNAPNLSCSTKRARPSKRPPIIRGKDGSLVEWTYVCTYLKTKGGSYRLEAAV